MTEYKDEGVRRFLWTLFLIIVFGIMFFTVSSILQDKENVEIQNRESQYYRDLYGE